MTTSTAPEPAEGQVGPGRPVPEAPAPPEAPTTPPLSAVGDHAGAPTGAERPGSGHGLRQDLRPDGWRRELVLWVITIIGSVTMFSVAVPIHATAYGIPVAIAFGVALLQAGSLPIAVLGWRWAAVIAFLVGQALFGIFATAADGAPWPVSVPQILLVCLLGSLLAWRGRPIEAGALWLGAVVVPMFALLLPDRGADVGGAVANLVTSASITAVVIGLGVAGALTRSRLTDAVEREREHGMTEYRRRLLAEERTRIARDLHDVVAHRMSVIQVQATSAPYRLNDLDEPVAKEFREIAQSARDALREMRDLLAVLRAPDAAAETAPQPGYADLLPLVESVRRAGVPVTARIDDALPGGAVLGQVVYRIVQEALSNVLRHADGAATTVTVRDAGRAVMVTVENAAPDASSAASAPGASGPGASGQSGASDRAGTSGQSGASVPPGASARPGASPTEPHTGHGVVGMRERARLVGGTIDVGPAADGGFRVHAMLPVSGRAPGAAA